jgi:hypothetical protein
MNRDDIIPEQHVVAFTGNYGNGKVFVNVVGPFPSKREATNYAASRRRTQAFRDAQHYRGLVAHVRPLWSES